jgi:hypothetical protein
VPPEWRELLEAIVAGTPVLRGALCRGFPEVFDAPPSDVVDRHDRHEQLDFARHACRVCPALLDCARWVDSLPRGTKPIGVVAGVLRQKYASVS